jgi:hypothetical protein
VGGSFVFPPKHVDISAIRHVVFIAGGVGINPLMSMLAHMAEAPCRFRLELLYSTKLPGTRDGAGDILFLDRLLDIFLGPNVQGRMRLFLTRPIATTHDGTTVPPVLLDGNTAVDVAYRRFRLPDLADALPSSRLGKARPIASLCGTPSMTDEYLSLLSTPALDMDPSRVFCEKWW